MFVEIVHTFNPETKVLDVSLHYFVNAEDENPIHIDVLQFSLDELVGPVPRLNLRNQAALRDQLYNRMQHIQRHIVQLFGLVTILDAMPEGKRWSPGEVVRILGEMDDPIDD